MRNLNTVGKGKNIVTCVNRMDMEKVNFHCIESIGIILFDKQKEVISFILYSIEAHRKLTVYVAMILR